MPSLLKRLQQWFCPSLIHFHMVARKSFLKLKSYHVTVLLKTHLWLPIVLRMLQSYDQYGPSLTVPSFFLILCPCSLRCSNISLLSNLWLHQVLSHLRDLSQNVCSAWYFGLTFSPFHLLVLRINLFFVKAFTDHPIWNMFSLI